MQREPPQQSLERRQCAPTPTQEPDWHTPELHRLVPQQLAEVVQWPPSLEQVPEQTPLEHKAVPQQSEELEQCEPGPTQPPSVQTLAELQVSVPQQSVLLLQWLPLLVQGTLPSVGILGPESLPISQAAASRNRNAANGKNRRIRGATRIV